MPRRLRDTSSCMSRRPLSSCSRLPSSTRGGQSEIRQPIEAHRNFEREPGDDEPPLTEPIIRPNQPPLLPAFFCPAAPARRSLSSSRSAMSLLMERRDRSALTRSSEVTSSLVSQPEKPEVSRSC
jgi:hypothetical protein